MVFETVIPAISTPTPNIAKPKKASFAEAGIFTKNELKNCSIPEPTKPLESAKYLIDPPITIVTPDVIMVNRMPILSRIIPPDKIRKKSKHIQKTPIHLTFQILQATIHNRFET